jgi:hypothetical protein
VYILCVQWRNQIGVDVQQQEIARPSSFQTPQCGCGIGSLNNSHTRSDGLDYLRRTYYGSQRREPTHHRLSCHLILFGQSRPIQSQRSRTLCLNFVPTAAVVLSLGLLILEMTAEQKKRDLFLTMSTLRLRMYPAPPDLHSATSLETRVPLGLLAPNIDIPLQVVEVHN